MIDLEKLKNFDVKDIDVKTIISFATEHQNTLIKILLIIGTLVLGANMFNDYRAKDQGLRAQTTLAEQKIGVIKDHDSAMGAVDDYKASLPKNLSETDIITMISQYAKSNQVDISSLTPGDTSDMGLYDVFIVSFNAESDNFKDLLLFLRKIEKSKPPLRIDLWTGQQNDNGKIEFQIKVSAILIHT